jgi:mono/diheme cytochrome c family protein
MPHVNLPTFGIAALLCLSGLLALPQGADRRLSAAEARKLKSPIPYSRKSIARGRSLFSSSCVACHGPDGKALLDVVADATDLTSPKAYKSGTTDGEIFSSIRDGAGETMPPFRTQISGEPDLWHLVNYIHSLWPEPLRPPLAADESKEKDR